MTRDELHAYHSLLISQAMYKAYISATSDSTINCAWNYYAKHGDYDRRIRALLYKGTTAKELDKCSEAMFWFKLTELESQPKDYYHRGYAQEQMGLLYQLNYETRYAIDKYRNAIDLFINKDMNNYRFCCKQLAQLYQKDEIEVDSSMFFINIVKKISEEQNDSLWMAVYMSTLIDKEFYDSCYAQAKDLAVRMIYTFNEYVPNECWYFASQSYFKLGMADSAMFYFNNSPEPVSNSDSTFYFHTLSLISELKQDWSNAHKYEVLSNEIAEQIMLSSVSPSLKNNENEALALFNSKQSQTAKKKAFFIISAAFIIAIVILYLFFYLKSRKNEEYLRTQVLWLNDNYQKHISDIQEIKRLKDDAELELSKAQEKIKYNEEKIRKIRYSQASDAEFITQLYAQLSSIFDQSIHPLGKLASDYFQTGDNATLFMKRFNTHFTKLWKDNRMWNNIEDHLNRTHHNAIDKLSHVNNITTEELRFAMLLMLGFNSTAIAICMGYKTLNVVYATKSKLKRKLHVSSSLEEYLSQLEDND